MKHLFFCFMLILSITTTQAQPTVISGQVTRIIDGDTFEMLQDSKHIRCRIFEVDAPEKEQPYGKESADSLSKLLLNKPILCLGLGRDIYFRQLVKIYQLDNQSVNLDSVLVSRGWAWSMKGWNKSYYNPKADPNQVQAQAAGRGLWQCQLPVLPFIWRNLNATNKRKVNSCK